MATCSYQTLARYDDDCSRKYRARDLNDIRKTHREALARERLKLKCLQMLQNRRTLVDVLFADDYEECYSSTDNTENDHLSVTDTNPWLASPLSETQCSSPWSTATATDSGTPWSNGESVQDEFSSPNYHCHQINSLSDLPDSFLEEANSSTQVRSPTRRLQRRSNQQHVLMYKQSKSPSSSSSSSSSPKPLYDTSATQQNFDNLMRLIDRCPPTAQNYSHLIESSWRTVLDGIQDPNTGSVAINFLKSACQRNLITTVTLVDLLQHGLSYSLCAAIYTLPNGTAQVCDLLITVISTEPALIPYLVEVLMSSNLSKEMIERINVGSDSDIQSVIKFYHKMTEIILSHKDNPLHPVIPQILMTTGVSQRTLKSYGPSSTIQKYLNIELIKSLVTRCLNRTYSKYATNLDLTLELLAHVVKFAYICDDEQWVVKTLSCLRDLNIPQKMNCTIRGLQRLARQAESSEHFSQGIGHDKAVATAQVCTQFLQFYEQYYNYLAQGYSSELMACESDCNSGGGKDQSHSLSADCWVLE